MRREYKPTNYHRIALKILSIAFLFYPVAGCVSSDLPDTENKRPAHHTKGGFQNPYLAHKKRSYSSYLKMRYFSNIEYADYEGNAYKVPVVSPDLEQIRHPADGLQITWIGHATMLIQYKGIAILTDPIFSDRASPVGFAGPKRYTPPALRIPDLPKTDFVVISHNHYDHLDRRSVQKIGSAPVWLVPLGLKSWFVEVGVAENRVIELDWWEEREFDRTTITAIPAQHWSARSLWDRNRSLWASWMLEIDDATIWYSGDTGYNPHQFKEIGRLFNTVDLALITIGAYQPRWFMKDMHINPTEAVQIFQDIKADSAIGIQWGTFQLTAEPIDDPPVKLREALAAKGISQDKFETMKIGEIKVIQRD